MEGFRLQLCMRMRNFRVILDLGPATRGHALILPKEHYANVIALPEEVTAKAFILAKKMAAKMMEVLHCDGVNVVQNNGEAARTDRIPFPYPSDPAL